MCIPWKPKPKKITTAPRSPPRVYHVGGPSLGVFPFNPLPPDVTQGCATTYEKKKTKTVEPGWKSPPSSPPHLNTDTDGAKLKKLPPSQPPQPNSDSDGAKSKQSKKTSASDQKHASPNTTIAASPPPKSNSDSDVPSPERAGVLNQPPPSPEKNKMGAMEPLQNYHHRNLTTYQDEGNTKKKGELKNPALPPSPETHMMRSTEPLANNKHEYENSNKTQQTTHENRWSSAPEEQTRKPGKPSSNDKKNRNSIGDKWSSEEEDISNHTVCSNF